MIVLSAASAALTAAMLLSDLAVIDRADQAGQARPAVVPPDACYELFVAADKCTDDIGDGVRPLSDVYECRALLDQYTGCMMLAESLPPPSSDPPDSPDTDPPADNGPSFVWNSPIPSVGFGVQVPENNLNIQLSDLTALVVIRGLALPSIGLDAGLQIKFFASAGDGVYGLAQRTGIEVHGPFYSGVIVELVLCGTGLCDTGAQPYPFFGFDLFDWGPSNWAVEYHAAQPEVVPGSGRRHEVQVFVSFETGSQSSRSRRGGGR